MEGAEQESQPYEAPNTIPVPTINGDDLPLHSMIFRYDNMYSVMCDVHVPGEK